MKLFFVSKIVKFLLFISQFLLVSSLRYSCISWWLYFIMSIWAGLLHILFQVKIISSFLEHHSKRNILLSISYFLWYFASAIVFELAINLRSFCNEGVSVSVRFPVRQIYSLFATYSLKFLLYYHSHFAYYLDFYLHCNLYLHYLIPLKHHF